MKRASIFHHIGTTVLSVGLAFLLPGFCHAQGDTAAASDLMGAFSNNGVLTATKYMQWIISGQTFRSNGTLTIRGAQGSGSNSLSGSSYGELKNNTGNPVTIQNPSPSMIIKASGSTNTLAGASASSTITLGGVTSSGSCSGPGGSYSDPKTVTFAVLNLQPGMSVIQTGSFSLNVNGG